MQLTKEQSEWLIEKFNSFEHLEFDPLTAKFICNSAFIYKNDIHKLINECTEKEFPEFELSIGYPWSLKIRNFNGITWIDTLKDGVIKQTSLSFEEEEFKQFTDACNKIVEWLQEQK